MNANCAIDSGHSADQNGLPVFAPGTEQKWLMQ